MRAKVSRKDQMQASVKPTSSDDDNFIREVWHVTLWFEERGWRENLPSFSPSVAHLAERIDAAMKEKDLGLCF